MEGDTGRQARRKIDRSKGRDGTSIEREGQPHWSGTVFPLPEEASRFTLRDSMRMYSTQGRREEVASRSGN